MMLRRDFQEGRIDQAGVEDAIDQAVGDANLAWPIIRKAARAACEGRISINWLARALVTIRNGRQTGRIKCPGSYFVISLKGQFRREGVPWNEAEWPDERKQA